MEKIGCEDVFPYPIKLTYDEDYIYLTPMWIPKELEQSYGDGKICLCLELASTRKVYLSGNPRHPSKGGKFRVVGLEYSPDNNDYVIGNMELGTTYSFSYNSFTDIIYGRLNDDYEINSLYIIVRGSYRLKTSSGIKRITFCEANSNKAKIDIQLTL